MKVSKAVWRSAGLTSIASALPPRSGDSLSLIARDPFPDETVVNLESRQFFPPQEKPPWCEAVNEQIKAAGDELPAGFRGQVVYAGVQSLGPTAALWGLCAALDGISHRCLALGTSIAGVFFHSYLNSEINHTWGTSGTRTTAGGETNNKARSETLRERFASSLLDHGVQFESVHVDESTTTQRDVDGAGGGNVIRILGVRDQNGVVSDQEIRSGPGSSGTMRVTFPESRGPETRDDSPHLDRRYAGPAFLVTFYASKTANGASPIADQDSAKKLTDAAGQTFAQQADANHDWTDWIVALRFGDLNSMTYRITGEGGSFTGDAQNPLACGQVSV